MKNITPTDFKELLKKDDNLVLVDVREAWEHDMYNIGGILIPLGELMGRKEEIPSDRPVLFYCEKGIRSMIAIQRLEALGYTNLYNLAGGMKAWKEQLPE